ncbi:MAG: hypothetical protein AMXMBFR59_25670 [Rhodanobacteraceae bacterium]
MDYEHYRTGAQATAIPFVDPAAVEAWDAWFRWREGNELRDITIEATWSRVARALSALEPVSPASHEQGLFEALASWRLLVDARIVAGAGRDDFTWPVDRLVAGINLAAFVSQPFTPKASLRADALAATVALAVRVIDNVLATGCRAESPPRLGIVGFADALAMLGIDYTSDAAVTMATTLARTLAAACLVASSELARERGNLADAAWREEACDKARRLDLPPARLQDLDRHGLRLGRVLSADPQPRLALFANNVADALSPLRGERQVYSIASPGGRRQVVASGFAITLWQQLHARSPDAVFPFTTAAATGRRGEERIHAAVLPWLDGAATVSGAGIDEHAVV